MNDVRTYISREVPSPRWGNVALMPFEGLLKLNNKYPLIYGRQSIYQRQVTSLL